MRPLAEFLRSNTNLCEVTLRFPPCGPSSFNRPWHEHFNMFAEAARNSLTIQKLTHIGSLSFNPDRTISFKEGEKLAPRAAKRMRLLAFRAAWVTAEPE